MKGRSYEYPSGVLGGRLGAVMRRLSGAELGDALDQAGDDVVAAAVETEIAATGFPAARITARCTTGTTLGATAHTGYPPGGK